MKLLIPVAWLITGFLGSQALNASEAVVGLFLCAVLASGIITALSYYDA